MSLSNNPQKWFVAQLLFECRIGVSDEATSWEGQIRLVKASNADEAFEKSVALGTEEQSSYMNGQGEHVHWLFLGLTELDELDAERIDDGIEIASKRFRERVHPIAKSRLAVFWSQKHDHLTADEILSESPNLPRGGRHRD